ncbi:hypothetical protein COLO4_20184 [Corchorus olitorius]|uniref:Uncharacterized protein n=1 Tax=Corchorus olitorius TaxID=93759 RepID=A0A1R3J189_9ROSI|nr:hypothetical protein COLO4_20184 [Corchorus olitorius]
MDNLLWQLPYAEIVYILMAMGGLAHRACDVREEQLGRATSSQPHSAL